MYQEMKGIEQLNNNRNMENDSANRHTQKEKERESQRGKRKRAKWVRSKREAGERENMQREREGMVSLTN